MAEGWDDRDEPWNSERSLGFNKMRCKNPDYWGLSEEMRREIFLYERDHDPEIPALARREILGYLEKV